MLERYRNIILGAVLIAVLGGIVAVLTYRPAPVAITIAPPPPTATASPTSTPSPSPTAAPIKVYVTGAVVNADAVYELPAGSRVQDAILAAGGARADADLTQINMAKALVDGDQIKVPSVGAVGTAQAGAKATESKPTVTAPLPTAGPASASDPVHVNTGDLTELERLPRVGPVLGQAIIDYRTKHGPFKTMRDLDRVPGVGPATLKAWTDLIVFD